MNRPVAYAPFVAAMMLVVVASNVLVQFPVQGQAGPLALADVLTWGAFTYPFAFLVTDLANRRHGPAVARRIVLVGFVLAVACSIVVPPLLFRAGLIEFATTAERLVRIACASGAISLQTPSCSAPTSTVTPRPSGSSSTGTATGSGPSRCAPPATATTPRTPYRRR